MRRSAAILLALTVGSALLVGCGHRDPSSYGDTVQRNFIQGCQVLLAGGTDNANDSAVSAAIRGDAHAAQHQQTCGCVYRSISAKSGGIPFKDFKKLEDQVRAGKALGPLISGDVTTDADLKKYAQQLDTTFNTCASKNTPTTAIPGGGGVVTS